MKRIITILVFLIGFSVALKAQPNTGNFAMQFDNEGITSVMHFYVPADYDSTKSYPFIYGWHGAGMAGSSMRDMLYIVLAEKYNAIVTCPDANNLNGQPSSLLTNLINQSYQYTLNTYNIDMEKIVITGFSWGGAISYQLGLGNPEMFNGIIGLAPAIGAFSEGMWANIKSIRMATILGDKDFNFSAVNALMTSVSERGGEILYKIKPGVEHVDNAYFNSQEFLDDYSECWEFVLNTGTVVEEQTPIDLAEFSVYPNPATDYLVVENLRDTEVKSIELFDVTGRLVKTFDSENETNDISDLETGFYVLKVTTPAGVTTKKIIVE